MSIPLDRLYHYIENIAKEINDNIIIYQFWPHGSKKLENLQELSGRSSWQERTLRISVYCHDQEPLNYNLYQNIDLNFALDKILKSVSMSKDYNLLKMSTIYDQVVLIHSEKRSADLIAYQTRQDRQCIDVYYWCHAIIALDWFRFAQHVEQKKRIGKTFLVYNRAWSGTREYRLKFTELLIKSNLQDHCCITINPIEPELGIHYNQHQFSKTVWRPDILLENYFPINTAQSHYSADFCINDYENTDIEVILETLFDDGRLHLTEKSLRPIACGQPFILAGTHGSLEYLRSYGFQTFGDIWDESYDSIEDPLKRLHTITDLMKQITNWSPTVREQKISQANAVAEHNRQHFFSQVFFDQVITELKNNLRAALNKLAQEASIDSFVDRWKKLLTYEVIQTYLKSEADFRNPSLNQIHEVLKLSKNLQKN